MITVKADKLGIRPGDRILDIGCGEGRHTVMAGRFKNTCCIGADFLYDSLLAVKNKIAFHRAINDLSCKSIDLSCMDITCLPFKDNSFDIVICSEVLEHIPEDNRAVTELARVLKPGCSLAVSVPRYWPEKICWTLSDEYTNTEMGHVRIYNKKSLIHKIESFGFVHRATHYAHSLHTPFWWLKCFTGLNRTDSFLVNLYHRFLVWDMMKQPKFSSFLDKLLNPVLGKSMVLYFTNQER